jgi:hypothetical protein
MDALFEILSTYGVLGLWTLWLIYERLNDKKAAEIEKKENKELLANLNLTIKTNNECLAKVNENILYCQRKHK